MTNQNEEKIDAYLMGKLSGKDRQLFEVALEQDNALAAAVAERRELLRVVEHLGDHDLQGRLKKVANDYHAQQGKVIPIGRTRLKWLAGIAAGIALIITAYLLMPGNTSSPQQLYASYYEVYPLQGVVRSEPSDNTELFAQIRQSYNAQQYERALPLIDSIYQQTEDSKWLILQANALMETGQYQSAITTLLPLVNNQDLLYEDQARWYLALAYLKTNKVAEAKAQLTQLAASSATFKSAEAEQILKDLE